MIRPSAYSGTCRIECPPSYLIRLSGNSGQKMYGASILNRCIPGMNHIDRVYEGELGSKQEMVCHQCVVTKVADLQGNRIVKDYTHKPLSFRITSHVDVPAGGGLGTSSTLVVSILGAFIEWLKLPLGEYDIARLAYEIERVDLGLLGGKQDQYAATFGGFNYMQFSKDNQVLVNPLRIKANYQTELAHNLLLFYTQTSHVSAEIIKGQVENMQQKNADAMEAMHLIKRQTELMKEVLLRGEIDKIGDILNFSWEQKKKTAQNISNPLLEDIYETALKAGATGGKISGAGGGGFMFFYCPNVSRYTVERELVKNFKGEVKRYEFTQIGLETWTI